MRCFSPAFVVVLLFAPFLGCSSLEEEASSEEIFSDATEQVLIEVAYETGGEPYVAADFDGPNTEPFDPWSISRQNLEVLFEDTTDNIVVPTTLEDMTPLGTLSSNTFSIQDLESLSRETWPLEDAPGLYSFRILTLNGYLRADDDTDANCRVGASGETGNGCVLGVALANSNHIAIFKPVVNATLGQAGGLGRRSARFTSQFLPYVEQDVYRSRDGTCYRACR